MKTSLAHLPKAKQDEIAAVRDIICEFMDTEFIILFGSYARGDWVEDVYKGEDGITYEYKSDYDILVIVDDLPKYQYKGHRNRIKRKAKKSADCQTRLSIIMHSVDEFKNEVEGNSYFFTDIIKEGILLYSSERFPLPEIKELNMKQRLGNAKRNFENWFESANDFLKYFNIAFGNEDYKIAAFNLHQAVERFYTTILLVFTDYKPKLHDLADLGIQINRLDAKFKGIFPQESAEEKRLFELLRRAYVEARYNIDYKITREELEYLAERVKLLQQTTEEVCKAKIATFE
jgi:HEPN domain-containing protein